MSSDTIGETPTNQINEFQRIYRNGLEEIPHFFDEFTDKYPLIATICTVVFAILGISSILTFSITAIISGALLSALALALGKNIFSDPGKFWERLQPSLTALFTCGIAGKGGSQATTTNDTAN